MVNFLFMLIVFAIINFRFIKEKQVFSMKPVAKVKEQPANICTGQECNLLKSMIIYGRNGSGKSNLLLAFRALNFLVEDSAKFKVNDGIEPYDPFELDVLTAKAPTEFEVNFFSEQGTRYNYLLRFDAEKILCESLYYYPGRKKAKLFVREYGKEMEVGDIKGGEYKKIENSLYPNQLFLSKVGTEKVDSLVDPYTFLTRHLAVHIVHDTEYDEMLIQAFTNLMIKSDKGHIKDGIDKLLHVADTGIKGISLKENKEED